MSDRIDKLRTVLTTNNLNAMLITNPVNRYYLSGFDGTSGVLLIGGQEAYLVTDFRYLDQASIQAKQFEVRRCQEDLYKSIAPLVEEAGWKRLGFEAKHVQYAAYIEMKEKLPAVLIPLSDVVEIQRMIKNEEELQALRRGAQVLDRAYDFILSTVKAGMTEKDLALELEIFLLRQGAEERSFRFIVASGKRGAMPHGTASDKIMAQGELVTIDYGAVFDGYATDMTRTISLGEPNKRQYAVYNLVLKAQQAALNALKPGLQASEIDAAARNIFNEAGYDRYFGHGLGHGIGLETHEQPVLNQQGKTILAPGMVFTVEPGLYIPDWGGVRIEDMVYITDSGGEVLTTSSRELTVIY